MPPSVAAECGEKDFWFPFKKGLYSESPTGMMSWPAAKKRSG